MSKQIEHQPKIITLREISVKKEEEKQLTALNKKEEKIALEIEVANLEQQIQSLKDQSNQMLFELREKINQEKEIWKHEKEHTKKQAEEIGYKEGFQQGEAAALQQYESLLLEANKIVEKATEDYHRTIEKHQQAIVTLAVKIAEKILTKEIAHDETYVTSIIRKALEDLKDHSNIALYVSPQDYERVMNQKDELEQSVQNEETLSIYIDTKLNEGDCIINHPFGQIDISLDLQLQQIKDALEDKLTETES